MDAKAATAVVWTKGFRVSKDSDEFQRVVPRAADTLRAVETALDNSESWPKVLDTLSRLQKAEIERQWCALFRPEAISVLAASPTEDRFGRPNAVFVAATISVSWDRDDIGASAAQAHAVAARLAASYAQVFLKSPEQILSDLRDGRFLPSREFDLGRETESTGIDWPGILSAVKLWRGVEGVGTPHLLSLGANVLLGTRHEAETVGSGKNIDGFFDVRLREIHPLTTKIDRWARPREANARRPSDPGPGPIPHERPHAALTRIADAMVRAVELLESIVSGDTPKRKRH